jgi:hypothetical protein
MTTIPNAIGRGLLAGFAGTAVMTVSSTVEMRLRGRAPSTAPVDATAKVLGILDFDDDTAKNRFSNLVHWGYGTGWGLVHGLLDIAGLPPAKATAVHFTAIWGNETIMLPLLDIAPPVYRWGMTDIAIDVLHHAVYATVTGLAYEALS